MKSAIAFVFSLCLFVLPGSLFAQEDLEARNTTAIKEYLGQKKFAQARDLVDKELKRTAAVKQPPYVDNGTLYLYSEPGEDSAELLLTVAALKDLPAEERVDADWFAPLAALPDWTKAATDAPYRPFLLFARAYILVENKNPKAALAALEEAIALHPHFLTALAEKNHLLMVDEKYDEAKELARAAIDDPYPQADKSKAVFYRNLGYIAVEEDDLDGAEEFYNQSLELEPGHKGALKELEYIASLRKE
jgi:tetratricopeptide (TPR) repeat protein